MNAINANKALASAVKAAKAAGALMRKNLRETKRINSKTQHDIKLELDVRCQKLIGQALAKDFPEIALLGEEGITGDPNSPWRWVVDPIDGTVNFTYGIPHACVSIALQVRGSEYNGDTKAARKQISQALDIPLSSMEWRRGPGRGGADKNELQSLIGRPGVTMRTGEGYDTIVGVVYDPFCDELWTAVRGQPARLNGKVIHVSDRARLREAIVAIGFAKTKASLEATLPYFNQLVRRTRKVRMMGSAALAMVYVATGRFDAYVERGIRLWDVAAGGLIVECAGGEYWRRPIAGDYAYEMICSNGRLRKKLAKGL